MKPSPAVLYRYKYDPLDRLLTSIPSTGPDIQRFYNKDRLATEIQGLTQYCLLQSVNLILAQTHHQNGSSDTTLLTSDLSRSVIQTISQNTHQPITYTTYGYMPEKHTSLSLLGFNGERSNPLTGHYLLGNGYRAFNPTLMRFNSPDNLSPFGEGGINCYAYCKGDPVNFTDPTGHFLNSLRRVLVSSSGNLFRKPQLSLSLNFTNGATTGVSKYQNIQRIAGGVYIADEPLAGGGKSLVINGHGREGGHLISKNSILDPRDVIGRLKRKGVAIKDYSEVHLMICHSAEGGGGSLAQRLHGKFGVPVTAYEGKVGTFYSPAGIAKAEAKKVPWLYRSSLEIQEVTFLKSKQMDIRNTGEHYTSPKTGVTHTLNYRPVRIS